MLLYNSKYISINYLEVQYLFHINFYPEAKKLNSNELKAEFLIVLDKIVNRKGRHFLIDTNNIEHIFEHDLILWFNKIILPFIQSAKSDKIAWLFKTAENESISISETTEKKIEQKIFDDNKKAVNWLLEGAERKSLSFEDGKKPPSHHHQS